LSEPTVFLKLEVSAVLADSPMRRWRGVNETSELNQWNGVINASVWSKNKDRTMRSKSVMACVSDLLCDGGHASDNNLRSLTVRHLVGDDVDTTVTGHTDLGRKVAEINTDDGLDTMSAGFFAFFCDEIPDSDYSTTWSRRDVCVHLFRHCSVGARVVAVGCVECGRYLQPY
jgi:hypothetical protein